MCLKKDGKNCYIASYISGQIIQAKTESAEAVNTVQAHQKKFCTIKLSKCEKFLYT